MTSFTENKEVNELVTKYVSAISSKYEIDVVALSNEMKSHLLRFSIISSREKAVRSINVNKKCCVIISSGNNKGKPCKNDAVEHSLTGKYCGVHIKHEQTYVSLLNEDKQNVIRTLNNKKPCILLEENEYGNYEHKPTNFVFDKITRKVIGVQKGPKVFILTQADIELCKEYLFNFDIPETIRELNEEVDLIEEIEFEEEDEEEE